MKKLKVNVISLSQKRLAKKWTKNHDKILIRLFGLTNFKLANAILFSNNIPAFAIKSYTNIAEIRFTFHFLVKKRWNKVSSFL